MFSPEHTLHTCDIRVWEMVSKDGKGAYDDIWAAFLAAVHSRDFYGRMRQVKILKNQKLRREGETERFTTSIQPAWLMRTGSCSCLSLLQQGNETMTDRLLGRNELVNGVRNKLSCQILDEPARLRVAQRFPKPSTDSS